MVDKIMDTFVRWTLGSNPTFISRINSLWVPCQLQRLPPTHIRPYPRRRKTSPRMHVPPVHMRAFKTYKALKRNIRLAEQEI
jgi:hypothetical protein